MAKKRSMNELRQTKEYYKHPYEPVVNSIKYLCAIYPNNADLGAQILSEASIGIHSIDNLSDAANKAVELAK